MRRIRHQRGCLYYNERDPEAEEEEETESGDRDDGNFVVSISGVPVWILRRNNGGGDYFFFFLCFIVLPLCMIYGLYNLACLRMEMMEAMQRMQQ